MKASRHSKIIEIVNTYEISTQEELVSKLNEAGCVATQATVSRDIRDLRLIKEQVGGKFVYRIPDLGNYDTNNKYIRVFTECYVSMDMAMNILVIKTVSGMAMAVAAAIDSMNFPEVVGTIAGDDTIMCAIRSIDDTYLLMEKLKKILRQNG